VRPLGVVVGHVTAERVFEVASSEDQQPVETLGADDAARTAPRGQPALILPAPNVDASPSEGQGRLHAYRTTVAPRTAPSLSRGLLANGRVRGDPSVHSRQPRAMPARSGPGGDPARLVRGGVGWPSWVIRTSPSLSTVPAFGLSAHLGSLNWNTSSLAVTARPKLRRPALNTSPDRSRFNNSSSSSIG